MADDIFPGLRSGVGNALPGNEVQNLGRDQAIILKLLWSVDLWEGGQRVDEGSQHLPMLSGSDGKCPAPLIKHIENFQTVRAAGGDGLKVTGTMVPTGPSFMTLALLARSIMPQIYACAPAAKKRQEAASKALALAMRGLTEKVVPEESSLALGLVDRFYKAVTGRTVEQQKADIAGIQKIFSTMSDFLATVIKDQTYFLETPGGHRGDNAYAYPGHWAERKPADGIWFVKPSCRGKAEAFLVDLIIHEAAHFCGDKDGGAWCIDHKDAAKRPYGNAALALPREDAIVNAANYAWFAGTAELPPAQWRTGNYAA
jgi:hypothetical protein